MVKMPVQLTGIGLLLVLLNGCSAMAPEDQVPQIDVWLGGSPAKVTGKPPWPRVEENPPRFTLASGVDCPCLLTVHFPSGRKFSSWTSATCFFQDDGVVHHVALWPPRQQLPYLEAVEEVERLMKELKIQERPGIDPPFRTWRDKKPREDLPITRATAGIVEKGSQVHLEIKCDDKHKCWFVSVTFDLVEK